MKSESASNAGTLAKCVSVGPNPRPATSPKLPTISKSTAAVSGLKGWPHPSRVLYAKSGRPGAPLKPVLLGWGRSSRRQCCAKRIVSARRERTRLQSCRKRRASDPTPRTGATRASDHARIQSGAAFAAPLTPAAFLTRPAADFANDERRRTEDEGRTTNDGLTSPRSTPPNTLPVPASACRS
jgi:hypothetical protein